MYNDTRDFVFFDAEDIDSVLEKFGIYEQAGGAPAEAIGTASGGSTYCIGTSAAAAYASGLLALYRSETRYQSLSVSDFLDGMASQCDTARIPGYSTADHGKGCLYFH